MLDGAPLSVSDAGALKFGNLTTITNNIFDLPSAIVIGAVSGILGALLIAINVQLGRWRKKIIITNFRKVLEAGIFAFVTSTVFYCTVLGRKDGCIAQEGVGDESV